MMSTSFLLLALTVVIGKATPIVEGQNVGEIRRVSNHFIVKNPGTYPYMVIIEIYYGVEFTTCGGVLIKPDVVLTAAHCVKDTNGQTNILVHAGIVHLDIERNMGERSTVDYFKIHDLPKLTKDGHNVHADIAILWLHHPFQLSRFIAIAKLSKKDKNLENKTGTTIGWGLNSCGQTSLMLQKAEFKVMTRKECKSHFSEKLSKSTFCAISEDSKAGSSFGDSGGPFIIDDIVVGLLSYGSTIVTTTYSGNKKISCDPTRPAVYIKIAAYTDWIAKQLKAVSCISTTTSKPNSLFSRLKIC